MMTQTLKFVKIECPAYATVEFNCATSENLTVFGSGTSINVFPDGYYILHHARGGRIEVDTEGTMVSAPCWVLKSKTSTVETVAVPGNCKVLVGFCF